MNKKKIKTLIYNLQQKFNVTDPEKLYEYAMRAEELDHKKEMNINLYIEDYVYKKSENTNKTYDYHCSNTHCVFHDGTKCSVGMGGRCNGYIP